LGCGWASLGTARLTRGLARQGERQKPSLPAPQNEVARQAGVSTLGTNAAAGESRQGRQKPMIPARFFRPFGTWLPFGLESQR